MHLPLRYAASIPLLLAITFALVSPLLKHLGLLPTGRGEVPMIGFLIMGPVVALLFVIPNVAAALMANRYGHSATVFLGLFLLTIVLIWVAQGRFLNGVLQTMGGTDLLSPGSWLMVAVDVIACLAAAALIPGKAVA